MISSEFFCNTGAGEEARLFTLENKNGVKAQISNLGCALVSLLVPDKKGDMADVVLGYAKPEDYLRNANYFGVIVGRNSNRIKNAEVEIAGKTYKLAENDGGNNLHSGPDNMSVMLFEAEEARIEGGQALVMKCKVNHLTDGFPGTLDVIFTYSLTDSNELLLDYHAVSDTDTLINMTNHSYFNLAGHDSGNMHGHLLEIDASFYTPNDENSIPTGEILSVTGTPFDFRVAKAIGADIGADYHQLRMFGGYDNNFVLTGRGYRKIATVTEPASGRVMETWTDLPGVQLYTSNGMNVAGGKNGATYGNHQGFCLETQIFPNAADMPWLISPLYRTGETYRTRTAYVFR